MALVSSESKTTISLQPQMYYLKGQQQSFIYDSINLSGINKKSR